MQGGIDSLEKLRQEYVLNIVFTRVIEREQLLLRKYEDYIKSVNKKQTKDMLNDFMEDSREHIKLLKDKMIKLKTGG